MALDDRLQQVYCSMHGNVPGFIQCLLLDCYIEEYAGGGELDRLGLSHSISLTLQLY